jgi:membrane associated rhomboid family serine protease
VIFVPIGHDRQKLRRFPVVTAGLIVACTVIFAGLSIPEKRAEAELEAAVEELFEVWMEDPGLKPRPEIAELVPEGGPQAMYLEWASEMGMEVPEIEEDDSLEARMARAERQVRFDRVQERVLEARRQMPSYRWGYVPSEGGVLRALTSCFLHGDLMHLLGNMFFLYLAGIALEDRWGRLLYPAVYLVAGVVAAWSFGLGQPGSAIPLIGASGAVAGLMGAFLVRFAQSKIKFWFFFFFVGTFEVRAIIVLPLWLGQQMFYAAIYPDAPVAFMAHVGGFLFGAAVAWGMLQSGFEERLLRPAVARAVAGGEDPELDKARRLLEAGDTTRAEMAYRGVLETRPHDVGALRGLCETARVFGRQELLAERLGLLLRTLVRAGRKGEAGAVLLELREADPSKDPRPEEWLAAARALDEARDLRAGHEYERFAAAHPGHARSPVALLRAATLAFQEADGAGRAEELLRLAAAARPGDAAWLQRVQQVAERMAARRSA